MYIIFRLQNHEEFGLHIILLAKILLYFSAHMYGVFNMKILFIMDAPAVFISSL